ncbi:MAG: class I tRNA ligase family protein [Brevundimonas sp.]|nr:class I tRNA ligase family protein [Brevundimonas sp.]MDZ4362038.1 class I tRNA ligase family protein [Brevundimonas sp.]
MPSINILDQFARIVSSTGLTYEESREIDRHAADEDGITAVVLRPTQAEEAGLAAIPAELRSLDRFAARKAIVARAETEGWLREIEKTKHVVPHGDRSGVVIEPWLTDQWYVDAHTLAQPALKAVEGGDTVFEPKSYEKIYFEWLRNIEPWCISRQLWWGHRIPAWYGPDGKVFVAETAQAALDQALAHYVEGDVCSEAALADALTNRNVEAILKQDEDVLDTWFSSALWPFSTMGWPEKTDDLERFYPTSDLVTAADIIFFWVARMMMMGLHFMDEVPFKRVIINGLVRDEKGQKMSKSKGNVIDPLTIIDELGADPLRFTMAILSGTRDIKLSKQRIEGYRNFGTKLWNAARFAQMNEARRAEGFDPATVEQTINRWIRGELVKTEREVSQAIEGGRFDDAASALYRFVWNVFCDWYLELAKPVFNGADEAARAETRAMTAWTLDQTLKLLHPVMPFITEELWDKLAGEGAPRSESTLIGAAWPDLPDAFVDAGAEAEIGWLVDLVTEVRALRAEMNVPPAAKPLLSFIQDDTAMAERLERHSPLIRTLGRVSDAVIAESIPEGAVAFSTNGATAALSLAGIIDLTAERGRLNKDIAALDSDIGHFGKKLGNPNFVAKAAPAVIEEQRAKLAEAEGAKARLVAALARLDAMG